MKPKNIALQRPPSDVVAIAADLARHAPALFPLVRANQALLENISARSLAESQDRTQILHQLENAVHRHGLHAGLRRTRHAVMVRVALREIRGLADIDDTSRELAYLASACLEVALQHCRTAVAERFGEVLDEHQKPVPMVIMGMGKLGGGELNLGSDVDICFFYAQDGETETAETDARDFFARVARKVTAVIGDVTADGFVFRVDLRLRPEGTQGPLVQSFENAKRYYFNQGRPWERAVWLRAQPVAGDHRFGRRLLAALDPFIYPPKVDRKIATAMHDMVDRSRQGLKNPERDVKLGRGGIREAEFFVQALQLIWGGQDPTLRVSGTVAAAVRLEAQGHISGKERERLETAWALLRRVEHRIHMTTGYQTHRLPEGAQRDPFARSLGFENADQFDASLAAQRAHVRALFDSLLARVTTEHIGPQQPPGSPFGHLIDMVRTGGDFELVAKSAGQAMQLRDEDEAATHLKRWALPFGLLGKEAFATYPLLAARLLDEVAEAADPDLALRNLTAFLNRGGLRHADTLMERPRLTRRLVGLFGASPSLAQALVGFPKSTAHLLNDDVPDAAEIRSLHGVPPLDGEECVSWLRERKRTLSLRIGLAHLGGELSLKECSQRLTRVADEQIRAALQQVMMTARNGDRVDAPIAVVGLGSLGSAELGFGSDLDLVFVHGGRGPAAGAFFARIAQRLLRLLSCPDAEGVGYEIDTRLRPSGSHGTLVVSASQFRRYHEEEGQDWERQALVRARVVACTHHTFDAEVSTSLQQLAYERGAPDATRVATLRQRMECELAGENAHRYHPKLGFGALIDVEFIAQWLQMKHGDDPTIRVRDTTQALERLRDSGVLSSADATMLTRAQEFFRRASRSLQMLDPGSDGRLAIGGPRMGAAARLQGVRDRDGRAADQVFVAEWRRLAEQTRTLFCSLVAPIATTAPWRLST